MRKYSSVLTVAGLTIAGLLLSSFASAEILGPKEVTAPEEMVAKWEKECAKKDGANSCYNLGVHYAQTVGDEKAAIPYLKKACAEDSGLGCFNLGGLLIKQDDSREAGAEAFAAACKYSKITRHPKDQREATAVACRFAEVVKKNKDLKYDDLMDKLGF